MRQVDILRYSGDSFFRAKPLAPFDYIQPQSTQLNN